MLTSNTMVTVARKQLLHRRDALWVPDALEAHLYMRRKRAIRPPGQPLTPATGSDN